MAGCNDLAISVSLVKEKSNDWWGNSSWVFYSPSVVALVAGFFLVRHSMKKRAVK